VVSSVSTFGAKRLANTRERPRRLPQDKLSIQPEDTVAGAAQDLVPAGVGAPVPHVVAAVDFNDEARRRSEEVGDEAFADDHLTAEQHAQLATVDQRLEPRFGGVQVRAHLSGALAEQQGPSEIALTTAHADLLSPGKPPGSQPLAQTLCQARP